MQDVQTACVGLVRAAFEIADREGIVPLDTNLGWKAMREDVAVPDDLRCRRARLDELMRLLVEEQDGRARSDGSLHELQLGAGCGCHALELADGLRVGGADHNVWKAWAQWGCGWRW